VTGTGTLTVHADIRAEAEVSQCVGFGFRCGSSADGTSLGPPSARTLTSMGLDAQHISMFRWAEVTVGWWLVEITNTNGDVKAIMCDDAGKADALLHLIEYALPPDHPEYPQD
jgi:hypothetical protein